MKETTRDRKIKELFRKNYSPEEIANLLNISIKRVFKTLKKNYKPDKEKDYYLYFEKSIKIKKEFVEIYRKYNFFDSFGKIIDEKTSKRGI